MGHAVLPNVDESGFALSASSRSLVVFILSAGTFLGALLGGELAEHAGRRMTIMISCLVSAIGVAIQTAAENVRSLSAGRFVAGLGVGGVSAIAVLYVSEISPRRVRELLVSVYQWAINIGLFLAACVNQTTKDRNSSFAYRLPIGIQLIWAAILATGLFVLPESPRYLVKRGRAEAALHALAKVRGQSVDSEYLKLELQEIQAKYEHEKTLSSTGWLDCFRGGLRPAGNLRRVLTGMFLQMFQQWTGVNFIFYYGTTFFTRSGIQNPFLITVAINTVNVLSTPLSFWTIDRFGRRTLLISGALLMLVCQFTIAILGTVFAPPTTTTTNTSTNPTSTSTSASKILITFVCIYIFGFASTWGPTTWVVTGEMFSLPIRAKGVALSTASNCFWNFIIAYVTPYMVDQEQAGLGAKVFFVWAAACCLSAGFAYLFVPETNGLSLEQVGRMLEEVGPRRSKKWVDMSAGGFAKEVGGGGGGKEKQGEGS